MFSLTLDDSAILNVQSRQHQFTYSVDGSLPNPLEAAYAAIAGCAGVYARKACLKLEMSPAEIAISLKPTARPGNPMLPAKITTEVRFPAHFTPEAREAVMASVLECPVKGLITHGNEIEFIFQASDLS